MKRYLAIILCALMAFSGAFAQKKQPKRPDKALDTLERVLELGYKHYFHIEHDHDLDNIRDRIHFHEILGKYAPEYGIQFTVPEIIENASEGRKLKSQDELNSTIPIPIITFDN